MSTVALRKVIRIRRSPSDRINIIRASLVEIDEPNSQPFGNLDGRLAFVRQVLNHHSTAESPTGQGRDEDRGRESGGDFFGEGAEVVGVVCDCDSGGGFLVVVAELDRYEDVVGCCVGFDFLEDGGPVAAGAEGDCCCAAVA